LNGLPRLDQVVTQLRIIHNWVITGIQWMCTGGCWFALAAVLTRGLHFFIKNFQSWAVWRHNMTREKSAKHPDAIIFPLVQFWAHSTENYNPPQLWHMLCTILEVPLGSFLSTFNHDHLPSCSSFWHKSKESNGLILPSLRFASKSLWQIFIKVSSLVELVAELLLRLLWSFSWCQSPHIHV
jgi:hypothetical protein